MAKRQDTSQTAIALAFLVMNLDTLLRQLSLALFTGLMWLLGYRLRRPVITQLGL